GSFLPNHASSMLVCNVVLTSCPPGTTGSGRAVCVEARYSLMKSSLRRSVSAFWSDKRLGIAPSALVRKSPIGVAPLGAEGLVPGEFSHLTSFHASSLFLLFASTPYAQLYCSAVDLELGPCGIGATATFSYPIGAVCKVERQKFAIIIMAALPFANTSIPAERSMHLSLII